MRACVNTLAVCPNCYLPFEKIFYNSYVGTWTLPEELRRGSSSVATSFDLASYRFTLEVKEGELRNIGEIEEVDLQLIEAAKHEHDQLRQAISNKPRFETESDKYLRRISHSSCSLTTTSRPTSMRRGWLSIQVSKRTWQSMMSSGARMDWAV